MSETACLKKTIIRSAASLAGVLAVQIVALIWWASSINTRMNHVERAVDSVSGRVYALEVDDR